MKLQAILDLRSMCVVTLPLALYFEQVTLPFKTDPIWQTTWIVCCYLTPATRLVRCVGGFLNKQKAFPFALATLRTCTLGPTDGLARTGGVLKVSREDMLLGDRDVEVVRLDYAAAGAVGAGGAVLAFDLDSPARGSLSLGFRDKPLRVFKELGPGWYNVRTPFKVLGGLVDVSTKKRRHETNICVF